MCKSSGGEDMMTMKEMTKDQRDFFVLKKYFENKSFWIGIQIIFGTIPASFLIYGVILLFIRAFEAQIKVNLGLVFALLFLLVMTSGYITLIFAPLVAPISTKISYFLGHNNLNFVLFLFPEIVLTAECQSPFFTRNFFSYLVTTLPWIMILLHRTKFNLVMRLKNQTITPVPSSL
jgi:hypothetical protein